MSEGSYKKLESPVIRKKTSTQQHKPSNISKSSNDRLDASEREKNLIDLSTPNHMTTPITTGNNTVHCQPGSLGGPANPTMQINPLQHPAPNTSTPSNFMPTSSDMSNTPVHSQPGSLGGHANSTMQTTPLQHLAPNTSTPSNCMPTPSDMNQPPSYQHHPAPIVAIGNPGSGKSTILNALAGQVLFGSGISLGCGLTNQLDVQEANGRKFMDTPGVADDTYKKAAGDALKRVFHDGGRMKVLFFITQESGRIVSQDVTTMKLVLESVPEIGRNYGVIVNKIPGNVLSQLSEGETYLKLVLSLYAGIKDEFKHDNVLLLPLNAKLNNIDNAILHPFDIHQDLDNFINTTITEAYITPGKITEIRVDDFEQLNKQVEHLQSELKKNRERQTAETQKLLTELENIAKEKTKEHEEELQKMEANIRNEEEKMRGLEQRSETDNMKEEIINQLKQEMENQIKMLKQDFKQKKAKLNGKEKMKEHEEELQKMETNIKNKEEKMRGLEQRPQTENMKEEIINQLKQEMENQIEMLKQDFKRKKAKHAGKEKTKEHEEDLQKMETNIKNKEEKMRGLEQRSETENMKEEIVNQLKQEMENQVKMLKQDFKQKKAKRYNPYKDWNLIPILKKAGESTVAHGAHAFQ